ncbi:MAG: PIN domain-containing protein, partial [Betaproteobacteria bacterium]
MPLPKAPSKPATLLTAIPPAPARPPAPATRPAPLEAPAARDDRRADRGDGPAQRSSPPARLALVEPRKSGRKARSSGPAKLFVLDTNVLMHDPTSLFRFEEHDVFLPMMTLEELDGHKKGMSEVARNARQVSRMLDALVEASKSPIEEGIPLAALGNTDAGGRLYFQTQAVASTLPPNLPAGKADNQILGVVSSLKELHQPREVVLVSKDINMRVKARALGLP